MLFRSPTLPLTKVVAVGERDELEHLPYGAFSRAGGPVQLGVRYGDAVLDLAAAARARRPAWADLLGGPVLDPLMAAGPGTWAEVRAWVTEVLTAGDGDLHPLAEVELHLPWTVRDYVDFYASEHHAATVGRIFRPDAEPLYPNWRHLPVGYHGRGGSVVVSGTPVRRPCGQRQIGRAHV